MELLAKIQLNSSPSNIIELQDGNLALTIKNSTIIMNKDTYQIKETLNNHEKEINRILETKNRKLITISADKTLVVNELDENNHYILLQRINEPGKINSIIELSTEEILTCNCDERMRTYKYNKEKNIYELNNTYEIEELITHVVELKKGKVLIMTFHGDDNLIKIYSFDLNKKKIEKILLSHSSILWNNHESILNLSDKFALINLFNCIIVIDKENISIVQEFSLIKKDFISVMGLFKDNKSIIFSSLRGNNFLWECNEEGIWESKDDIDISILKDNKIECYLKTSKGKLLVGIEKGLNIFDIK